MDENNAHVPKDIRKDIKRRIKKRIKDRDDHLKGKRVGYNISAYDDESTNQRYNDPRDSDYYGYTDELRGAVIESCIGAAMCAIPCGATQGVGLMVLGHGITRVINLGIDYYYREPSRAESRAERRESDQGGRRNERHRDYCRED